MEKMQRTVSNVKGLEKHILWNLWESSYRRCWKNHRESVSELLLPGQRYYDFIKIRSEPWKNCNNHSHRFYRSIWHESFLRWFLMDLQMCISEVVSVPIRDIQYFSLIFSVCVETIMLNRQHNKPICITSRLVQVILFSFCYPVL